LLDSLDKNSPIHKFLHKRGPGIHHICLEVDNINNAISELKKFKIDILNDSPSIGAEGYKIVFIHPRSTGGVLVELAEKPAK
jgi:methylmalonyl-CoA/ethylmalonyl-CoA epimerase